MTRLRFHNRVIVVADAHMEATIERAVRASRSNMPVLLVGESGTGKELVARFIHDRSARTKHRFVSVNCAAIPEGLMEAELFGFERGAFTGAIQQRIGKFEQASGGTLLLDEISEMSFALQAKLLRVLQENEIDRLGGKDAVAVNTRILATTNKEPLKLIEQGTFRDDLFYRLNVIRVDCHPLRNRPDAIKALAESFLESSETVAEKGIQLLTKESVDKLVAYSWPGNIRELKNAIERASLLCDGKHIAPVHFDGLQSNPKTASRSPRSLAELEEQHIMSTLGTTQGNRTEAAKVLGISVRTLRNKLNEFSRG